MYIILALIVGILIGLIIEFCLNERLNELNEEMISNLKELNRINDHSIELYEKYCKDLEEAYNNCQNGINKTINENIELKKKLSRVK